MGTTDAGHGTDDTTDPATDGATDDATDDASEHEIDERTLTRNWSELLQEIRVTQTGVQILTGFLLTVPFAARFTSLDDVQKRAYLVVLCGSILTTALVVAPVAFHRILFRQRRRQWLVAAANQCARAGLFTLALTTCGVLFLVFDVVVGRATAWVVFVLGVLLFTALWAGLPLAHRRVGNRHG